MTTTWPCGHDPLHLNSINGRMGVKRVNDLPVWEPCTLVACSCADDDCPRPATGEDGLCTECREAGCKHQ